MTDRKGASSPWLDALAIFALFNLAVAYPLYEVLARNAEFFIFKRTTRLDLILLVFMLSILVPFFLTLIIRAASIAHRRIQTALTGIVIAILLTLMLLQLWKRQSLLSAWLTIGFLSMIGTGISAGYFRFSWIRSFIRFLAPAILIVPIVFLTRPMIYKILSAEDPIIPFYRVNSNTPIVMIVFDEFPLTSLLNENREVDSLRFPNFARLMKNATWYRNATSVAERTTDSLPAILTGNYPAKGKLPIARDYPRNLFTLLGRSYEMKVNESITRLCPRILEPEQNRSFKERMTPLFSDLSLVYLHIALPNELADRLPPVSQTWGNFGIDTKPQSGGKADEDHGAKFISFINSITASDRASLYFLHVMLPHTPWRYLPSGKDYGEFPLHGMIIREEKWKDDESLVTHAYQRHLLQVGYVDYLLGKLLDKLETEQLYDRSLFVVVADHGISFNKGGLYRFIRKYNYRDIIRIPLFIKVPYQKSGSMNDWNVQTTDIIPSIADAMKITLPWKTEGVSVLNSSPARIGKTAFSLYSRDRFEFESDMTGPDETLRMKISAFGNGPFEARFYESGICSELIGQRTPENSNTSGLEWILFNSEKFQSVDSASGFVPALITGHIKTSNVGTLKLAVAVNGFIRAVTLTAPFNRNTLSFSVMVPENVFQNGENRIDLYLLKQCGSLPEMMSRSN